MLRTLRSGENSVRQLWIIFMLEANPLGGRLFFVTEESLMGWSEEVKVGDHVCAFFGERLLYTIRKLEEVSVHWQLLHLRTHGW